MKRSGAAVLAGVALAAGLAGCGGSSKAQGVVQAPSAGLTAPPPPAPVPVALRRKPTVTVPKGPAPHHLVVRDLIKGTGPAAKSGSQVTVKINADFSVANIESGR